jgi:hypothetical protein
MATLLLLQKSATNIGVRRQNRNISRTLSKLSFFKLYFTSTVTFEFQHQTLTASIVGDVICTIQNVVTPRKRKNRVSSVQLLAIHFLSTSFYQMSIKYDFHWCSKMCFLLFTTRSWKKKQMMCCTINSIIYITSSMFIFFFFVIEE